MNERGSFGVDCASFSTALNFSLAGISAFSQLNVLTVGSNLWINPSGGEYITDQENNNARAKTQRDVKLLTAFLQGKNEHRKIEEI